MVAFLFCVLQRVTRFGGESGLRGGEWSSLFVAEEEDWDADFCGVGASCFEGGEWWSGVTVIAMEVDGGAEAIGSRSWGGSTAAGVE